jgi:hypothetical protein
MDPARANASSIKHTGDRLAEHLSAFMQTHDLSIMDLARLLRTTPETLESWFSDEMAPPACLLALMIMLQTLPRTLAPAGTGSRAAGNGDIFRGSNACEPGAQDREEALRRVRAI